MAQLSCPCNKQKTRSHPKTNSTHDVVRSLPDQPSAVSGYVTVDEANGRALFYYLTESPEQPHSKPLLLWLNGGPGCSSLIGAMTEIGPFSVKADRKTLYEREHAWNKVVNTLFLESPASVGFSYSNTSSDYKESGDTRTAEDSYSFLLNWFERFSQYKTRDLYIAGESYAGHYIPQLADLILQQNISPNVTFKIPLKGIMIGNGVMNQETDEREEFMTLFGVMLSSPTRNTSK